MDIKIICPFPCSFSFFINFLFFHENKNSIVNYFLFLMKTALSIIKITAATAKMAKRGFIVFVK